jgi:hypothetical protein
MPLSRDEDRSKPAVRQFDLVRLSENGIDANHPQRRCDCPGKTRHEPAQIFLPPAAGDTERKTEA